MKIREFITTPLLSDTVKVYNANGRRPRFGRVVGYGTRRRYPSDEAGFLYRRTVILQPTAPVSVWKTDFFFTPDLVQFLPPADRLIPQHASVHPLIFQS